MATAKIIGSIPAAKLRELKNRERQERRSRKFGKPLGASLGDALRKAGI